MQIMQLKLLFNLEILNLSLILHSFTRLSRLVLAFHSALFNYSPLLSFAHCNTLLNRQLSLVLFIVFVPLVLYSSFSMNRLPRSFLVHGSSPRFPCLISALQNSFHLARFIWSPVSSFRALSRISGHRESV